MPASADPSGTQDAAAKLRCSSLIAKSFWAHYVRRKLYLLGRAGHGPAVAHARAACCIPVPRPAAQPLAGYRRNALKKPAPSSRIDPICNRYGVKIIRGPTLLRESSDFPQSHTERDGSASPDDQRQARHDYRDPKSRFHHTGRLVTSGVVTSTPVSPICPPIEPRNTKATFRRR